MLECLSNPLPSGLTLGLLACLVCAAGGAGIGYGFGHRQAAASGAAELQSLRAEHNRQALQAAQQSLLRLAQQVERANQAEAAMLAERDRHTAQVGELQERIPHVTTVYRPAPAAAPVAIPHCVFTAGWLRDYNLALGVPAPAGGAAVADAQAAAWPASGADAELLESGVTPADILAHAQDYGRWARGNLAQLNALLDLHKD